MSEKDKKSSEIRGCAIDTGVSSEFVGEFRKGLVTGSSIQTTRNEIEQSKKPKE